MSAHEYAILGYIKHFRSAMNKQAYLSDSWHHFHNIYSEWVREWRKTNTLTYVKR